MEPTTEHDGQLSPEQLMLTSEQLIWGAQVHLAAMATLWASVPADEKKELIEETLQSFDDAQLFSYSVLFVESLGFDVQPLLPGPTPDGGELATADSKTSYGFYL